MGAQALFLQSVVETSQEPAQIDLTVGRAYRTNET